MISNLKKIYQQNLIENVSDFDENYYYFYDQNNELFGINKSISEKEYQLLKQMYIEKTIYNTKSQAIYEYLLENKIYPFTSKKKMIIYSLKENDEDVVLNLLKDIYQDFINIKLYNLNISFINENNPKISDLFETLSIDLGYDVIVHEGLIIKKGYQGKDILAYIRTYHDNIKVNSKIHSDVADMILFEDYQKNKDLLNAIKTNLFEPILKDVVLRDIIQVMLKNDLNVSQSAKLLYMNRNTLINKIEYIYKETGLNIQKFNHACVMYFILNLA